MTGKTGEVSTEEQASMPALKAWASRSITSFKVLSLFAFPVRGRADRRINGIVRRCASYAQFKAFPGWWKEDRKHAL
ncbi:hypothetical protein PQR67_12675 [Paraburkholderia fungorum]|uniref:hypothetical protein n=1 Tax=Paraburkholderia fungorum TaxID=134537 RepID=UPI0038B9F94A